MQIPRKKSVRRPNRPGAAAVELAVLIPFLFFLFVGSVDLARFFYNSQVIAECARATAQFGSNPNLSDKTKYESAVEFGKVLLQDLSPPPTISISHGTDGLMNRFIDVEVQQQLQLVCPVFLKSGLTITKKSRAMLSPSAIDES